MISPDTGNADDSSDASATASVPLDELSVSDVPPSQGDKVNFTVDGVVQSVNGSMATIKITAINGEGLGPNDNDQDEMSTPSSNTGNAAPMPMPSGGGGGMKASIAKRGAMFRAKAAKS